MSKNESVMEGIADYLKLGAPCALMICLEWWAYQIMQFMSGYFGVASQASNVLLMTILSFGFMAALGLQQASSTLVGQEIGKGDIVAAKQYYLASKYVSAFIFAIIIVITVAQGEALIDLFLDRKKSHNQEITDETHRICSELLIYCLVSKLGDYWQVQLQGTIRALGIQKDASNQNLIAYWLINIPLAMLISFWPLRLGYRGLWVAISIA